MYPIREATLGDLNAIEALIEASVWGLATGDYSDAKIRGALAGAWGVDTQLIRDETYFVVDANAVIAAGGWSYRQTLFGNDTEGGRDPSPIDHALADGLTIQFVPMTRTLATKSEKGK